MQQLFYTSCRAGQSVSGSSGFQVRAKGPSITGDKLRAAIAYAGYALPVTMQPDDNTWQTAPVRLAMLDTQDVGRIVCRSVYVGKDPETGRYGNFFTHMLLDVPEDMSAGRVMQSWESLAWQGSDDGGPTELPDLQRLPKNGTLDHSALSTLLQDEMQTELMRFLLSAYLSGQANQRIFLVAPATEIAICIYGLLMLLDPEEQRALTFSTYESEPLSCTARIVGTWFGESSGVELSSSCFHGSNVGFNPYTGKKSELQHAPEFVNFAIQELRKGQTHQIDKYRALCSKYGASDSATLDVVYRVQSTRAVTRLTKQDASQICRSPKLATQIASKYQAYLNQCVTWAEDDEDFFDQTVDALASGLALNTETGRESREQRGFGNATVDAWLFVKNYLERPTASEDEIWRLAEAVSLHPSSVRNRVRDTCLREVGRALRATAAKQGVQQEVECVLASFASLYGDRCSQVYRMLLAQYLENPQELSLRPHLLTALVAIGIGRILTPSVKLSSPDELFPDVRRMALVLRRKKLRKALNLVTCEAKVQRWQKKQKNVWKKLKRTTGDRVFFVTLCLLGVLSVAALVIGILLALDVVSAEQLRGYLP
ncbi:MAG: hypothetical protein MI757_09215 [Pirellulales bacterium]|nr:hypothetical protein [Pirellulales bacterium]